MKAQHLQQRLIGEIRRSPVKAALLAVLLLAAAWFWGPLVWKLFAPSHDATTADAASLVAPAGASAAGPGATAAPAAANSTVSAAANQTKRPSWRTVIKMVDQQKATRNGLARLLSGRNPFDRLEETQVSIQSPASTPPETRVEIRSWVDPAAGLKLAAVSIGKERRVAIINGRAYAQGDVLAMAEQTYRLVSVEGRRVVLEGGGERFELKIPEHLPRANLEIRAAPNELPGEAP
jgi:hypothetical protein